MDDSKFKFEIVEHVGTIKVQPSGWYKEINLVSWNGTPAKYDLREWSPDHTMMSRGITLSEKEMVKAMNIILNKKPEIKKVMEAEKAARNQER